MNRALTWVLSGLSLALTLFSTGCATSKAPMVDTWCNPQFSPTPQDKIALTNHPLATAQDEALGQLLTNELQHEGFSIVPPGQADYLLAYVLDKADKEQQVAYVHPAYNPMMNPGPLTPQTDAQMSGAYQSTGVRQWNELQAAPLPDRVVTYHFTSKYIRLLLYTNPKTHDGNFQLVWQGNIDVNHGTSAAQEQALLKTLLGYFGRQQNGRVTPGPQE